MGSTWHDKTFGYLTKLLQNSISSSSKKYVIILHLKHFLNHKNEPFYVDRKTVDVNKMVSDLVFEVFLHSKPHMLILLSEDYKTYGVGLN